jgi:hypothetical protein
MPKDNLRAEFKNGKKIITHPSGVVTEYSKSDLETEKQNFLDERQRIDLEIASLGQEIARL